MSNTYVTVFDYDVLRQRIDAPKENFLKWLEDQAVEDINRRFGLDVVVFKTRLVKRRNGRREYWVRTRQRFTQDGRVQV